MKILGLIFVIAIVVIGYCVYNPMIVDSADFANTETGKSSSDGCKGPFGVDSQKILNDSDMEYNIGVVSKRYLEKDNNNNWYVHRCEISNGQYTLYFMSPYPQQSNLVVGDFIGFSAAKYTLIYDNNPVNWSFVQANLQNMDTTKLLRQYYSCKIVENISLQSVNCKIDDIHQLSKPSYSIPPTGSEEDFVGVTGVIMAVKLSKNSNSDTPDDFSIRSAVMKCGNGELFKVYFVDSDSFMVKTEKEIKLPSQNAFGEGDVVTVTQVRSPDEKPLFWAYYQEK